MNFGQIHKEAQKEMFAVAKKYNLEVDNIEERNWAKLDKILDATSESEAAKLARKALDSFEITCLHLWSMGKVSGVVTAHSLEKKAQQAESLAQFQDKMGNKEAKQKQLLRAEALREEAIKLKIREK